MTGKGRVHYKNSPAQKKSTTKNCFRSQTVEQNTPVSDMDIGVIKWNSYIRWVLTVTVPAHESRLWQHFVLKLNKRCFVRSVRDEFKTLRYYWCVSFLPMIRPGYRKLTQNSTITKHYWVVLLSGLGLWHTLMHFYRNPFKTIKDNRVTVCYWYLN